MLWLELSFGVIIVMSFTTGLFAAIVQVCKGLKEEFGK